MAFSAEDCDSLLAQGLITSEEAADCRSYFVDDKAPIQQLTKFDSMGLGMDSYWIRGPNPLTTAPVVGREPDFPYTYEDVYLPAEKVRMDLSGREAQEKLIASSMPGRGIPILGVVAIGVLAYWAGCQKHKARAPPEKPWAPEGEEGQA